MALASGSPRYPDSRLATRPASAWTDGLALAVSLALLALLGPLLNRAGAAALSAAYALLPGLLLIIGTFAGRLAVRLHLPRLTGYILVGAALGPDFWIIIAELLPHHGLPSTVFVSFDQVHALRVVNDLAIGLIALMAGAEIRLSWLRARLRPVLTLVAVKSLLVPAMVAGVVLLCAAAFPVLDRAEAAGYDRFLVAALIGAVALTTSPMVVVSVIKETGSKGPLSETAMGLAVLIDVLVIVFFTILVALLSAEGGSGLGALMVQEGGQTLRHLLGSCLVGVPLGWLLAWITERGASRVAWMVVGVGLAVAVLEPLLHVKPLFALLTAGFVCENLYPRRSAAGSHRLEASLARVAAPVFVIFFVVAGLGLHLHELLHAWAAVLILVLTRIAAMYIAFRLGAQLGGSEPVVKRYGFLTMIPQAGITLGLAIIIGQQFDTWGPALQGILVACVTIYELIGPLLLTWALKWSGELGHASSKPH